MKIHKILLNSSIFTIDEVKKNISILDKNNKKHIFNYEDGLEESLFYNITLGNNKKIILNDYSKLLTLNDNLMKEFIEITRLNFKSEILTDYNTGYSHTFKDKTYLSTKYINFFYKNIFLKEPNLIYSDLSFFTKELFENNKINIKKYNNELFNLLNDNYNKYNHLTIENIEKILYRDYIKVDIDKTYEDLEVVINGFIIKLI